MVFKVIKSQDVLNVEKRKKERKKERKKKIKKERCSNLRVETTKIGSVYFWQMTEWIKIKKVLKFKFQFHVKTLNWRFIVTEYHHLVFVVDAKGKVSDMYTLVDSK